MKIKFAAFSELFCCYSYAEPDNWIDNIFVVGFSRYAIDSEQQRQELVIDNKFSNVPKTRDMKDFFILIFLSLD